MSIFRKRCNRALCLQMLAMLFIALVWLFFQVFPALPRSGEPDLFFGTPNQARQSPLFGRVSFRINGDNNAEFVLWMNPANRARFNEWFGPNQPIRIDAMRTYGNEWMILAMGSSMGELDFQELFRWRATWLMVATVIMVLGLMFWLWLLREYTGYFRHRPWFRNR